MPYQRYIQITLNSFRFLLSVCIHILIAILVVYGISWLCVQGYQFCYEIFGPVVVEEAPGTEYKFEVSNTDTMWQVAENLEKQNLIVNRYSFYLRTRVMDPQSVQLIPGEYALDTSMTYEDIINQLTTSNY